MNIRARWIRYPETVVAVFLIVTAVGNYTPPITTTILYFIIGLWVIVLATRYFIMRESIAGAFGGQLLNSFETPRPSSSMLVSLRLQGHSARDISKIDMMTYDLAESCKYLASRGGKFCTALRANPDIDVKIYGHGAAAEENLPENIEFISVRNTLIEHINKIVMNDGSRYVWYEPQHEVINGVHDLPRGAYLVKIDTDADWEKVEDKFGAAISV